MYEVISVEEMYTWLAKVYDPSSIVIIAAQVETCFEYK